MSNLSNWTAYHGIRDKDVDPLTLKFRDLKANPEGIHLGSLDQAKMRAGGGTVLEVTVHGSRLSRGEIKRVTDRSGNWRDTNKRLRRSGSAVLCYLNRYEGVNSSALEKIMDIGSDKFDRMSDSKARKLVPELKDSWVILEPEFVTIERILSSEAVSKMLLADAADADEDLLAQTGAPQFA